MMDGWIFGDAGGRCMEWPGLQGILNEEGRK
jgi:hypothetical protein